MENKWLWDNDRPFFSRGNKWDNDHPLFGSFLFVGRNLRPIWFLFLSTENNFFKKTEN